MLSLAVGFSFIMLEILDLNYQFIGGTAGSVLASRLSEDRGNRVLVVEAGVE